MHEDNLDKIARLLSSIHVKYSIDTSFTISCFLSDDVIYRLWLNNKPFDGNREECIAKLEDINANGLIADKDEVLASIKQLQLALAKQQFLLDSLEVNHAV